MMKSSRKAVVRTKWTNSRLKHFLSGIVTVSIGLYVLPAQAQLEEVIVTATKRETGIQSTPIAITAVTGADLARQFAYSSVDLAKLVPNLQITTIADSTNPVFFLRGVGNTDFQPSAESSVGIYVDEVYIRTPFATSFELFDLERVEVLRGPQGTLFGRNTSGGAINFITKRPTEELEASAMLIYGEDSETRLAATVSGPIVEGKVNGRLTGQKSQRDGLIRNNFVGGQREYRSVDNYSLRGSIEADLTENLDLFTSIDYASNDSRGKGLEHTGINPGGVDNLGYADTDGDPWTGTYDQASIEDYETYSATARFDWRLSDDYTITSLSSYRDLNFFVVEDSDGSPGPLFHLSVDVEIPQYTQEIRLAADDGGNLTWVVGLFAFDEHFDLNEEVESLALPFVLGLPFVRQQFVSEQDTTAYALFSEANYRFSDAWSITMGLRYSKEKKDFALQTFGLDPIPLTAQFDRVEVDESWEDTSPKVTVDWELNPDTLIYLSWANGFKAGGFSAIAGSEEDARKPYEPEDLVSWELGVKSSWFDRRVQVNGNIFTYSYEDLQVVEVAASPGVPPSTFIENAGEASIRGAELEIAAAPLDGLSIQANLAYLDAEFDEFLKAGNDLSGNTPVRSPEFSGYFSLAYSRPLSEGLSIFLNTDYSYIGRQYYTTFNEKRTSQEGYGLVNGSIGIAMLNGRFEVSVYGRNLTDEEYFTNISDDLVDIAGSILSSRGRERNFGVRLDYRL